MPRQPVIDLPHIAHRVFQRGNDRQPCFFQGVDYPGYLSELHDLSTRTGCAIHAYVLMTNTCTLAQAISGWACERDDAGTRSALCPLCQ